MEYIGKTQFQVSLPSIEYIYMGTSFPEYSGFPDSRIWLPE